MRISDWSSDVCSSDLSDHQEQIERGGVHRIDADPGDDRDDRYQCPVRHGQDTGEDADHRDVEDHQHDIGDEQRSDQAPDDVRLRSEEHTSELQSLMRISYAVFCLKKKTHYNTKPTKIH